MMTESPNTSRTSSSTFDIISCQITYTFTRFWHNLRMRALNITIILIQVSLVLLNEITFGNIISNMVNRHERVCLPFRLLVFCIYILVTLRICDHSTTFVLFAPGTFDIIDFHYIFFRFRWGFLRTSTCNIIVLDTITHKLWYWRGYILKRLQLINWIQRV